MAAIDGNNGTTHIGGRIGGEHQQRPAHLLHLAGATHRHTLDLVDAGFGFQPVAVDLGAEEARANGIAANVVAGNNAGINRVGTCDGLEEDDWDAVVDTDLKGVWAVSKFAIRQWRRDNRPGNLINIASILGLRVGAQLPAYVASKAAVVQLTKSIALDYARYNIRCNAICPGFFRTEINSDWLETEAGINQIKRVPMRRTGQMKEMSGPLLMLASDASAYMSGSIIAVDGGHLCSSL